MGQWNDFDFEMHDNIECLVHDGELEEGAAAYGIAQKVIHEGLDSLTTKQRYVYDREVGPALADQARQARINELMASAGD